MPPSPISSPPRAFTVARARFRLPRPPSRVLSRRASRCPPWTRVRATRAARASAAAPPGTEARFTVFAADASARARPGGAAVVAVTPSGGVSGGDAIAGAVDDLGDGTYACSYVVPSRGDYDVAVTLDGDAIRGRRFPRLLRRRPASNVPANPMTASAVAGVAAARPPTAAAVLQPATRYPPPPPPPAALDEMQRTCQASKTSCV